MAEQQSCIVAQIGARMHYAVPRIFYNTGRLAHLYTDLSVDHGLARALRFVPKGMGGTLVQRLRDRKIEGIPPDKVTAFGAVGIQYSLRLRRTRSEAQVLESYLFCEQAFSRSLLRHGVAEAQVAYAFNGGARGLFAHLAGRGVTRVLEQTIAPKRIENTILQLADPQGTDMALLQSPAMQAFLEWEEEEWALADAIVCASDFVREGLVACGVDSAKCHVVPYGVDLSHYRRPLLLHADTPPDANEPVTVLFIGAAGARKGVWTLLAAMQRLNGLNLRCRIIGPVVVDPASLCEACPANTEIVGPLPRSAVAEELAGADIFCLPSLCEGSATVIYEALAAGLPVVTTHNSGSIVRDGIEGIIVPVADEAALAEALARLAETPDLRAKMALNALERSAEGSLEAYAARLVATMDLIGARPAAMQQR